MIVERKTKWHISHLPSLHHYNENQIVFITKSETDETQIIAMVFNQDSVGRSPLTQFVIGSNESQYPTDCVFLAVGETIIVALNKRTKASEPY